MEKIDVLIVGAGISGLTTAREIGKRAPNIQVKILEAKNRVGGRTQTLTLRTATGTDQWDIGGQWVGETQNYILDLLEDLDIETYPQFVDGTKCGQFGSEKIRNYDTSLPVQALFSLYSPLEAIDVARWVSEFVKAEKKINVEDPFSAPEATEWDSMTVEDYVRRKAWTNTVIETASIGTRAVFGQSASRLSMLWFLLYGKASGTFLDLLEATGNGAQRHKIKNGAQQISERMASDFGMENVLLNRAVFKIEHDDGGVTVWSHSTSDAEANVTKIRCKRLILSIPPQQIAAIQFSPHLPEEKHQLFNGFQTGNLIKFIVTYQRTFWKDNGFSGEIAASGLTCDKDTVNPIIVTYDATSSHGNPAIVGFLNLEWADVDEHKRRDSVLKDLARYLGPEALQYIDYVDKSWSKEPYTGGCPTGCVALGNMENYMRYREPTGRIHWAGTESAIHWPGYMSGAVQSGLRAAYEILHAMVPQSVTEKDLEGSVYAKNYKKPRGVSRSYVSSGKLGKGVTTMVIIGCVTLVCFAVAKRSHVNMNFGALKQKFV